MRTPVFCGRTLLALCLFAAAACSNSTGATTTTDTAASADAAVSSDSAGGADSGGGTHTDTVGGETAAVDIVTADTGGVDTATAEVTTADSTAGDTAGDATTGEVKADTTADAKPPEPTKCTADSECPKGFGDCIQGQCDVASGKCLLKIATDGTECKTGGICGGSGKCAQGACEAKGACSPAACSPKPLKCGDKLDLDLSKLGASTFSVWPCSGLATGGGEVIYALSNDTTAVAVVELAEAVTGSATLLLLAGAQNGQCNPTTCSKSGVKLTVGLPIGVTQIVALDSKAAATGSVTVTVTCTPPTQCGDGACTTGETCSGCPKDCGVCKECGDAKCDAATENCGSCPADCGACPPPAPGCSESETPGCSGCSCEKCVCDADDFCCKSAWDGLCVKKCASTECGGKCPAAVAWCGDGKCAAPEVNATCPQDCPKANVCGDGACTGTENCTTCAGDCGPCAGGGAPVSGCGNGKCDATEHCGVCPKDCGMCSADCAPTAAKQTPGCPGCACEAKVCAADPFCCKTAWDNLCVAACQEASGAKCPKQICGDTVCSGTEACETCAKDCGACVCGDGKCQASEKPETCPADCKYGSCKDSDCKGQSTTPNAMACYCDDKCEGFGDCCPDKKQFCP